MQSQAGFFILPKIREDVSERLDGDTRIAIERGQKTSCTTKSKPPNI